MLKNRVVSTSVKNLPVGESLVLENEHYDRVRGLIVYWKKKLGWQYRVKKLDDKLFTLTRES